MNISEAVPITVSLIQALQPASERIAVAGSIRRQKPVVKDIEIVAIPKWGDAIGEGQLAFGGEAPVVSVNLLQRRIEELVERSTLMVIKPREKDPTPWHLNADGKYWNLYLAEADMKIDLFLPSVETWGLTMMIRTGSAEFSQGMLARWKRWTGGGYSKDARLYKPAHRAPEMLPEERDVFNACHVPWVEPNQRETDLVLRRLQ